MVDLFTAFVFAMVLCSILGIIWEIAERLYIKYVPEHVRTRIVELWQAFKDRRDGKKAKPVVAEEAAE